jgi:hypothetical protein
MRWSDELTLISETIPADEEEATNENGFALTEEGDRTTVFANKKSVGFNEFFKAKMAGYNEELKFDVFTEEYTGQTLAEYNCKRYRVLRSYIDPKTSGEYTELTLSDLSERGDSVGGDF